MASDDIITLKFPDNVRTRPGMYLGSLEDTSTLLREIIDNSIDEMYRSKSANRIEIDFLNSGVYRVKDNGRGIPVKKSKSNPSITMIRESLENLHSGSKFDNSDVSIGMNGIGSSATSALSDYYLVYSKMSLHKVSELPSKLAESYNKESHYYCRFEKGLFVDEGFINLKSEMSTIVEYKPDATIFESIEAILPSELNYIGYIVQQLHRKKMSIYVNGKEYNSEMKSYHTNFNLTDNTYQLLASIGMRSNYDPLETDGSVNGLNVPEGLHIRWFHRAFCKAFNQLYGTDYSYEEILYGLECRVIMLCPEPIFPSQTKEKLAGLKGYPSKGDQILNTMVLPILGIIKKEKAYWNQHLARIKSLIEAKDKINTRDLVKDTFRVDDRKKKNLPSKLFDCTTKVRKNAELFISEGSSSQSSLMQSRDSKIHAVLAIRGKILNTVGKPIDEIIGNQEVRDIINAIGIGTKDYCKPNKLRYGKIIISADADADGFQIVSLVLGLLFTHLPILFDLGVVYALVSPLFKVGEQYVYTDTLNGVDTKGKQVKRYKGLGSLGTKDMKKIAMDPSIRVIKQITAEDGADYASQLMTNTSTKSILMMDRGIIKY